MSGNSDFVVRFAPSPTGFLHIGGARTALFNRLLADANGGRMLLRIEDTDRLRSTREAIDAILEGLRWLEIRWDGDEIYQSSHASRHRSAALGLLASGKAYRCYCSSEELESRRVERERRGEPRGYDRRCRDLTSPPFEDAPFAVRFRAPTSGRVVVDDLVQGRVEIDADALDDLILLRSDGSPTYTLSVTVDDMDAGVTHAVRGDDHLTNAARQSLLHEALGSRPPRWAHIPLIHGSDGAKLSKRHGALGVEEYRAMGFLPSAMKAYLVRLGWSHGDQEEFSPEELVRCFSLEGVGRSPARFDEKKLRNVNGKTMRETSDDNLFAALRRELPHLRLPNGELNLSERDEETLRSAIGVLKPRAETLVDLAEGARFLFRERPIPLDDGAKKILADEKALKRLRAAREKLADDATEWTSEALEALLRREAESEDVGLGKFAQPLRAALTGSAASPGIFDVMRLLGADETLARLDDCLES